MDNHQSTDDSDGSSSEIETEVSGTCSDLSQEIDLFSNSNQLKDSCDETNDDYDIYESLLKETPKMDPIDQLEAFLKSIHEDDQNQLSSPQKQSATGVEIVKETRSGNGTIKKKEKEKEKGKQKQKQIKRKTKTKDDVKYKFKKREKGELETSTRTLRPRVRTFYWKEASIYYMKAQENIISYYSELKRMKRS